MWMQESQRGGNNIFARATALLWLLAIYFVASVSPAQAQTASTCAPATAQGSGPATWQTYCWLNFSGYNDATAATALGQNFSITLSDGATLTFNVKRSGPAVAAAAAPSWTGAAVGNSAFTGIPGRPILYQQASGNSIITISNITITPAPGAPAVSTYMFVAADAESTDNLETLTFATNGGGWQLLDSVPPIAGSAMPTYTGIGSSTFVANGNNVTTNTGGYIVGSTNPNTITTTLSGKIPTGDRQGAMFAVRFASMRLTKQIRGARVNAADQFKFDIASSSGTQLATGTSSGTGNGPFNAAALSLASGVSLSLRESMATGSVSALSKYQSRINCTNGVSSSTPLPNNVILSTAGSTASYNFGALQFGDAVQCAITNAAFPHLQLSKALGGTGRRFASDQFIMNINNGATNVATTTTTGPGTTVNNGSTAQTQVNAATSYTLSEAASGTAVLAQYTNTIACANAWTGSTTSLPATLNASFAANITPQLGDVISCTITNTPRPANASLAVTKISAVTADGVSGTNPKAVPGATIRYSINISNSGTTTVSSNSIFILDPLPANFTYNASSAPTFTQGAVTSGLTFTAATDVRFAGAGPAPTSFANCTLPAGTGFNSAIRYVCMRPQGIMAGATVAGQPNFTVNFQGRIE
jgi:uncharacterized repeat protein (TIGR01451 family)